MDFPKILLAIILELFLQPYLWYITEYPSFYINLENDDVEWFRRFFQGRWKKNS